MKDPTWEIIRRARDAVRVSQDLLEQTRERIRRSRIEIERTEAQTPTMAEIRGQRTLRRQPDEDRRESAP